jgi:ribosomal protein S18 acetylase RimI-like enzyme
MSRSLAGDLLTLRPVTPDDDAFLRKLYRSTRVDELAPLGWSDAQLDAFCNSQFDAQTRGYRDMFPDGQFLVICAADAPVGRLTKARVDAGLYLADIALLPAFRNRGWGTALLRDLQDEASRAGVPLLADVEVDTAAPNLYRRLGFVTTGVDGVRFSMVWTPTTKGA